MTKDFFNTLLERSARSRQIGVRLKFLRAKGRANQRLKRRDGRRGACQ